MEEKISHGFRFGDLAYSTDFNNLSDKSLEVLKGVRVLIIDCLRYTDAPSHCHLDLTLRWIERIEPTFAVLTHMAHEIDYEEVRKRLPPHVVPAYDGMVLDF